jgi:hypothetical protein
MSHMALQKAWATLGRDAHFMMSEVAKLPRSERVDTLRGFANDARKLAKELSAKNHPDVGGDPEKFRSIQSALASIEYHTQEFERKYAENARKAEERLRRRPVFIDVVKK